MDTSGAKNPDNEDRYKGHKGTSINITHHITVHGGSDTEGAVRRAMRQSDAELIAALKRAERADFRMAIG